MKKSMTENDTKKSMTENDTKKSMTENDTKKSKNPDILNNISDMIEVYSLSYCPIYSLPIRMPGITLSVKCSQPTFQLTLKGSCDEEGVFELNQKLEKWTINSLNYALGRLVYDIIWEEGLCSHQPVHIQISYSAIAEKKEPEPHHQQLVLKHWDLKFQPSRWLKLPRSRFLLKKIQVKWDRNSQAKMNNNVAEKKTEMWQKFQCEFKIAVATIPLKIIHHVSTNGELDFSMIKNQQNILHDSKLNFSHVFGAWLIFEDEVDWNIWHPVVTYYVDEV